MSVQQPTPPRDVFFPFAEAASLLDALGDLDGEIARLAGRVSRVRGQAPAAMLGRTADRLDVEFGQVLDDLASMRQHVQRSMDDVGDDVGRGRRQGERHREAMWRYEHDVMRWRAEQAAAHD